MLETNYARRRPGTKRSGASFTQAELRIVFNKCKIISGFDSNEYRLDACGALMKFSEYGKRIQKNSGWEVDHINPVSNGGSDDFVNLQALQWQNNAAKSDGPNNNFCALTYR